MLKTKLPGDLRTRFARTFNHGKWDLTEMMEIFKKELEAKECAFATINCKSRDKTVVSLQVLRYLITARKICVYFVVVPTLHQNVEKYLILKLEKTFYSKTKFFLYVFRKGIFHLGAIYNIVVENVKDVIILVFI